MLVSTLIQNALFVTLLAPTVWLASKFIRNPAVTHVLWVTLLVKLITPKLVVIPIDLVSSANLNLVQPWSMIQLVLGAIWICGSVAAMLILLRRAEGFRQTITRFGAIHSPANDLAGQIDRGGRLFKTPEVVLVDAVHSPMICGAGPYAWILFPKDLWYVLSLEQRRTLMAHELAHFRRGDCVVRLIELVVMILFWWLPVFWLIKREIHIAEEDCCDAIACRFGATPYAKAMLTTLDFLSEPEQFRPIISTLLLSKRNSIEQRIERILKQTIKPHTTKRQRLLLTGLAASVIVISPQFALF